MWSSQEGIYMWVPHPCFTAGFFHMSLCPKAGSDMSRHIVRSRKVSSWKNMIWICVYIASHLMLNISIWKIHLLFSNPNFFHLIFFMRKSSLLILFNYIPLRCFPAQDPFLSPFLGANFFLSQTGILGPGLSNPTWMNSKGTKPIDPLE